MTLWGSDEWSGLGGGAVFDAEGHFVRACNVSSPDDIQRWIAAREHMFDDDWDDFPDDEDDGLWVFERSGGLTRITAPDVIGFLDTWMKDLGAIQPMGPVSLWGFWDDYVEVWGARARSPRLRRRPARAARRHRVRRPR